MDVLKLVRVGVDEEVGSGTARRTRGRKQIDQSVDWSVRRSVDQSVRLEKPFQGRAWGHWNQVEWRGREEGRRDGDKTPGSCTSRALERTE